MDFTNKKKSAGVAAILNLCLPGTGYFYAGKTLFGIGVIAFVGAIIAATYFTQVYQIVSLLLVVSFCGMVDGFFTIRRYNRTAVDDIQVTVTCRNCKKKSPIEHRACDHCRQPFTVRARAS
ncbi:MAG: DUF2614 family zinc ribbon-containing protein [Bdellovibrionota bacterium]